MTNPKNDAMRAAFESAIENQDELLEVHLDWDDKQGRYGSFRTHPMFAGFRLGIRTASNPITAQLTRNHDGQPMLSLSNGQTILFKDIGGMADAVKAHDEDILDARRYRWLRNEAPNSNRHAPVVSRGEIEEMFFHEDLDKLVDAEIEAKGQS